MYKLECDKMGGETPILFPWRNFLHTHDDCFDEINLENWIGRNAKKIFFSIVSHEKLMQSMWNSNYSKDKWIYV